MFRWLGLFAAVVLVAGCGASVPQLRTRAAHDLSCSAEGLRLEPLDSATQVVTGCNKSATYVLLFNDSRYPTWLLNSNIEASGVMH